MYVEFFCNCDLEKVRKAVKKVLRLRIFEDEFKSNFKKNVVRLD